MTTSEAWITQQTNDPEIRRFYEEERLILWTTEEIAAAMEEQGLNRADVAEKLGTSRANITQLLSGSRNMTLRSLASLAHACGLRAGVHLEELTEAVFTPVESETIQITHSHPVRFWAVEADPELPLGYSSYRVADEEETECGVSPAPPLRLVA